MNEAVHRVHGSNTYWANVVLGIWVAISPFVLGFTALHSALWNNIAVGLSVLLLALSHGTGARAGSALNIVLGIWLIISPFALGFASAAPMWNNIILGAIITALALMSAAEKPVTRSASPPT